MHQMHMDLLSPSCAYCVPSMGAAPHQWVKLINSSKMGSDQCQCSQIPPTLAQEFQGRAYR